MLTHPSHAGVPGAEQRGSNIRLPIHFHPDVFDRLRKQAAREGSCISDIVNEILERAFGG